MSLCLHLQASTDLFITLALITKAINSNKEITSQHVLYIAEGSIIVTHYVIGSV